MPYVSINNALLVVRVRTYTKECRGIIRKPRMSKGEDGMLSISRGQSATCIHHFLGHFSGTLHIFVKILAHAIRKDRYVPVRLYGRHKCQSVGILRERYDTHTRKRNYVICARVGLPYFFSCNMPKNQFCVVHPNLSVQGMSRKARVLYMLSKQSPIELHSCPLFFAGNVSLYSRGWPHAHPPPSPSS